MFRGLIFLTVCLVATRASNIGSLYHNYNGEYAASYDNYEPKAYAYEYGVSDPHTGDHKSQWETKDEAGVVRGSYSLLDADGTTRIVDYIADDHGFRAVVKKVGAHGVEVQSHGGAEPEHPSVVVPQQHSTAVVVPEHRGVDLVVPEQRSVVVAPEHHHQEPVLAYNSYDGDIHNYNHFENQGVLEPKAQGLYINVPSHLEQQQYQEVPSIDYAHNEVPAAHSYVSQQEFEPAHQKVAVAPQEQYVVPENNYYLHQKSEVPYPKYNYNNEQYFVVPEARENRYLGTAGDFSHQQQYLAPESHSYNAYASIPKVPQAQYLPVPVPNQHHDVEAAYSFAQQQAYSAPVHHQQQDYAAAVPHQQQDYAAAVPQHQHLQYYQPKQPCDHNEHQYYSPAHLQSPKLQYGLNVQY